MTLSLFCSIILLFPPNLAFERSSNSTSNSFKLLATLLLLTAVVAITEDKSRCGTGGATLSFLKELLSR